MKTHFKYKSKKISLEVKECKGIRKFTGLMFKSKNTSALFFSFEKPSQMKIHSMFVFFDFVAVWLDEDDDIIDVQRVKPWRISVLPKGKFYTKLIEIPVNERYQKVIQFLVGN